MKQGSVLLCVGVGFVRQQLVHLIEAQGLECALATHHGDAQQHLLKSTRIALVILDEQVAAKAPLDWLASGLAIESEKRPRRVGLSLLKLPEEVRDERYRKDLSGAVPKQVQLLDSLSRPIVMEQVLQLLNSWEPDWSEGSLPAGVTSHYSHPPLWISGEFLKADLKLQQRLFLFRADFEQQLRRLSRPEASPAESHKLLGKLRSECSRLEQFLAADEEWN